MRKHRLQQRATRMALLGFEPWQCLAALAHAGGDLREAVQAVLAGRLDTPAQAQALLLHPLDDSGRAEGADEGHLDQLHQAQVQPA